MRLNSYILEDAWTVRKLTLYNRKKLVQKEKIVIIDSSYIYKEKFRDIRDIIASKLSLDN